MSRRRVFTDEMANICLGLCAGVMVSAALLSIIALVVVVIREFT